MTADCTDSETMSLGEREEDMKVRTFLNKLLIGVSTTEQVDIFYKDKPDGGMYGNILALRREELRDVLGIDHSAMHLAVVSFRICDGGKTLEIRAR